MWKEINPDMMEAFVTDLSAALKGVYHERSVASEADFLAKLVIAYAKPEDLEVWIKDLGGGVHLIIASYKSGWSDLHVAWHCRNDVAKDYFNTGLDVTLPDRACDLVGEVKLNDDEEEIYHYRVFAVSEDGEIDLGIGFQSRVEVTDPYGDDCPIVMHSNWVLREVEYEEQISMDRIQ